MAVDPNIFPPFSKAEQKIRETIKREHIESLKWKFQRWKSEVRLNEDERWAIEEIIEDLIGLIE